MSLKKESSWPVLPETRKEESPLRGKLKLSHFNSQGARKGVANPCSFTTRSHRGLLYTPLFLLLPAAQQSALSQPNHTGSLTSSQGELASKYFHFTRLSEIVHCHEPWTG